MLNASSLLALVAAASLTLPASHAQVILNGGFEDNGLSFTASAGYVNQGGNPAAITGWTSNVGTMGINGLGTGQQIQFLPLAPITQGTSVAFLQKNNNTPTLTQTVTGLTSGVDYWVTYRESARFGNTDVASSADFGGTTIVASHILPTNVNPYQLQIGSAYTATGTSATLNLNNTSVSNDRTLALDDVRLYYVTPNATPVGMNSSFAVNTLSANGLQQASNAGALVSCALWGFTGGAGIMQGNGGGFNPPASDDGFAALIQNVGTFSDVYGTFETGKDYQLTLQVAARGGGGNPFSISLGGQSILFAGELTYTPTNIGSYLTLTSDFFTVSSAGPKELMFTGLNSSGDRTTFIDNIQIIPEPSTYAMVLGGLAAMALLRRRRRA